MAEEKKKQPPQPTPPPKPPKDEPIYVDDPRWSPRPKGKPKG